MRGLQNIEQGEKYGMENNYQFNENILNSNNNRSRGINNIDQNNLNFNLKQNSYINNKFLSSSTHKLEQPLYADQKLVSGQNFIDDDEEMIVDEPVDQFNQSNLNNAARVFSNNEISTMHPLDSSITDNSWQSNFFMQGSVNKPAHSTST